MKKKCRAGSQATRVTIAFLLSLAVLAAFALPALAEEPSSPMPFSIESEDGDYLFFFNPGNMFADYPASGLYYNTEPPQLIYMVEGNLYWAFESSFVFTRDLRYFALIAPMAYPVALEFYANGRLHRKYRLSDLVGDVGLQNTWLQAHSFDADDNTLSIATADDLAYVFDITTGEMLEGAVVEAQPQQPPADEGPIALTGNAVNLLLLFAVIGGGVSLVVIIDLMVSRKRRAQKPPQAPPENDYFDFRG